MTQQLGCNCDVYCVAVAVRLQKSLNRDMCAVAASNGDKRKRPRIIMRVLYAPYYTVLCTSIQRSAILTSEVMDLLA